MESEPSEAKTEKVPAQSNRTKTPVPISLPDGTNAEVIANCVYVTTKFGAKVKIGKIVADDTAEVDGAILEKWRSQLK